MPLYVRSNIGARADRLCLERLERPAAAHFIRRDTLDIGLQADEIHQRKLLRVLRAEAGELKIADHAADHQADGDKPESAHQQEQDGLDCGADSEHTFFRHLSQ